MRASAGYHYQPETGLYRVRHRDYHAQLGKWLQRDPIGYVDGMNLYQYVGSMPTYYVDPMGTDRWVSGTGHLEITYPVYNVDGSIKEYRRYEYGPYMDADTSLLGALGVGLGATVWDVKGGIWYEVVKEEDISGTRYETCREADIKLHNAMEAMAATPPRYRMGHNSRNMVTIWRNFGIKSAKYEAWAKYDLEQALKHARTAALYEEFGFDKRASLYRKLGKKYREQAKNNSQLVAVDDLG